MSYGEFGDFAPARHEFDALRVEWDARRSQGIDPMFAQGMLEELWEMFLAVRLRSGPREQVYTAQTMSRGRATQVDIIVRRRSPNEERPLLP